jgi:hypothetical protein
VGNFSEEPGYSEGVGTIDYHIYTAFPFPIGVVDYGREFRRQRTIGNLKADFFCASWKLVIELDGNPYNNQPPRPV